MEDGESESPSPATTANSTAAPAPRAEQRGSRIPENWRPPDEEAAFAKSLNLDPGKVTAEFVDYWRSVPGAKGRKLDWPATFRNRCREIADRRQPARGGHEPPRLKFN